MAWVCCWFSPLLRLRVFPHFPSFFSLPAACRLFSRGLIFTRAHVLLALLSLRKNGRLLVVYPLLPAAPPGNQIEQILSFEKKNFFVDYRVSDVKTSEFCCCRWSNSWSRSFLSPFFDFISSPDQPCDFVSGNMFCATCEILKFPNIR